MFISQYVHFSLRATDYSDFFLSNTQDKKFALASHFVYCGVHTVVKTDWNKINKPKLKTHIFA